jgi:branched-chain amino acid transport system substrate-binding protein
MKKTLAILLALIMIVSLAACGGGTEPAGNDPEPTGPAILDKDEIVIGYVGAQTGPSAGLGYGIDQILKWGIDELNKEGGILGVPVRYVSRDDQGDPTKATTYIQELVYKENIDFLVGPVNSTCVAANLDFLTENEVLTMICSASATALVDPVKYPYMFRTTVVNDFMAEALVQGAVKGNFEHVVLIAPDDVTGQDGMAAMKKYAEQYNLKYEDAVIFTAGAVDMTSVAQAIQKAQADCIISFSLGMDTATIVKALDRLGLTGTYEILGYMGAVAANFQELTGIEDTIDYVYYQGLKDCSISLEQYENPDTAMLNEPGIDWYNFLADEFGEYLIDGSGRQFGWIESGRAYDCLRLYKYAVEQTGSVDPNVLAEFINTIDHFDSVLYAGGYDFSKGNHEGFDASYIANCYMGLYAWDVGNLRGEPVTVRNSKFD